MTNNHGGSESHKAVLEKIKNTRNDIIRELRKFIVGQSEQIDQLLAGMFAGGHSMIQGPPGTAKTVLLSSFAKVMDLECKRIQFTPDLMPSDISGTEILEEDKTTGHRFVKFVQGPVFANMVIADEINRTPPKTQAALLEVMQEKQVTLGGKTYPLPKPFYILATQISMEQEGTYPLPEAQQDRFMLSIMMEYLPEDEEVTVVRSSTSATKVKLEKVIGGNDLIAFNQAVRNVVLPEVLGGYIVDLVVASRPGKHGSPDFVKEYVSWGAGLRASQNISLMSKSIAAMDGRATVELEDVLKAIIPVLRHRIGLSFRAEVDRITVEDVIQKLIQAIPKPNKV
ncbi:MAG TPA: AAA family ATPase [Lentisphaeria bacterium]|nr:MAG: AAA family ATPase [Lentisphaerae bacterium GWF2_50_93]HCE44455.1 AAA family ATPase [Lentisphaeria bacterium]